MTTVGTFDADLSALAGNAITVLASGFLSPNDDNNGMPFGLFVALPTGGQLLELSTVTSIDETNELSDMRVFPNPISNNTQININSTIASEVDFRILSVDGAIVYTGKQNLSRGENQLNFSANLLARGTYYLHLDTGTNSRTIKLLKIE